MSTSKAAHLAARTCRCTPCCSTAAHDCRASAALVLRLCQIPQARVHLRNAINQHSSAGQAHVLWHLKPCPMVPTAGQVGASGRRVRLALNRYTRRCSTRSITQKSKIYNGNPWSHHKQQCTLPRSLIDGWMDGTLMRCASPALAPTHGHWGSNAWNASSAARCRQLTLLRTYCNPEEAPTAAPAMCYGLAANHTCLGFYTITSYQHSPRLLGQHCELRPMKQQHHLQPS